jgi:excinuclease UvrABC nuclease subunit
MRPLSRQALKKVGNRPGNYVLYDAQGRPIYVGHSRKLRHRLQSYIERDDFKAHPTKRPLRRHAAFFRVRYRPVHRARRIEKRMKRRLPFNFK